MGLFSKGRRAVNTPFCSCVVPAAGSSARMGRDKIAAELGGKPVIARTLEALEQSPFLQEIILVTRKESLEPLSELVHTLGLKKVSAVVLGGQSRAESVFLGCRQVNPRAKLIAIHDGARPLVSQGVIAAAVKAAAQTGAAAPALAVKDTIKSVGEGAVVTGTVKRDTLRTVQTPQVFDADLIRAALKHALEADLAVTDDCSAVEALGHPVVLTEGSEENLKLTTPFDFLVAEAILRAAESKEAQA